MTQQNIDFKKFTKAQLIQALEDNDKAFNEAAFRLAHTAMDMYNALELSVVAIFEGEEERQYYALPKESVDYVKNVAKEISQQFAAALGGHIEFNAVEEQADESED